MAILPCSVFCVRVVRRRSRLVQQHQKSRPRLKQPHETSQVSWVLITLSLHGDSLMFNGDRGGGGFGHQTLEFAAASVPCE